MRHHDHWDAADDSVAFGINREQTAADRRPFDRRHVSQQTGESDQIGAWIGAADGEAGLQRCIGRGFRFWLSRAGLTDHDPRMFDRLRQRLIVQLGAGLGVDAAKASLGNRR